MLERIKNLRNDPLIRGSFILLVMLVFYNIFNYVYQISAARMLGPADYSVLAALMSLIYIFSIPSEAIQTAIAKYASVFNAHNKLGKIKDLLMRSIKKSFMLALVIFVVLLSISFVLSDFLNINIGLIILTDTIIFFIFILPVMRGILQGMKKFSSLGISLLLESFFKVILGILLIVVGWKVYGAIAAVVLASFFAFLLIFAFMKNIIVAKREREEFKSIYMTNLPIIAAMTSIVLMYSIDILLARRFFSPQVAGEFAFVSLIGKVIIFTSSAIGKALFPLSSEGFEKGKNTLHLFKKAFLLVLVMSIGSLAVYALNPELIIKIISLGSTQYLGASHVLFVIALAYSLISLTNIIVLYKLSINKIHKGAYFLFVFVIVEAALLTLFSANIVEFSYSLLFSSLLMFLYSLFLIRK